MSGPTADAIYERLVCEARLYGHAFFGWKPTRAQKAELERLWQQALRESDAIQS